MKRIFRNRFVKFKAFLMRLAWAFNYEIVSTEKDGVILRKWHHPSVVFAKKHLKDKTDLKFAEIGIWKGENVEDIIEYIPHIKKFWAVDAWNENVSNKNLINVATDMNQSQTNKAEKEARKKLVKYGNKVIIIKETAKNVLNQLPKDFDYIFIDIHGNRRGPEIKETIEDYYKLVKVGGILSMHDINNGAWQCFNNGVPNAVAEFVVEKKLNLFIAREDWWIVKK